MTIKIYSVLGLGLVMGEKIKQDDEKIYLKYPGIALPNQQTPEGPRHLMVEPIHDFFAGKDDLLEYFPIKKIHVLHSGKPSKGAIELYDNYSRKLRARITGIEEVGADIWEIYQEMGEANPY